MGSRASCIVALAGAAGAGDGLVGGKLLGTVTVGPPEFDLELA